MMDESVSLHATPERSDDRTNSDGWKYSTGKSSSSGGEPPVLSRYLRASTGSCHDFCKYGRHSESKAKERYQIPKRRIRKPEGDQTPIQNPYITEQKAKSIPSSNTKSNSDPVGKRCVTKSNQSKSGMADSCKNIASSSKSRPLSSLSNSSEGLSVERSSKHEAGKDLKTPKATVIQALPPKASASLPKASVIEAVPPVASTSLSKAAVIEALPPVAPASLLKEAVVLEPSLSLRNTAVIEAQPSVASASLPNTTVTDLPQVAPASLPMATVMKPLPAMAPASLPKAAVMEAPPPVASASFSKATVTEDVPSVAPASSRKPLPERASKNKINSPMHKNRYKIIESKDSNMEDGNWRSYNKYAKKIMASAEPKSTQNQEKNGKKESTKTIVANGTGSETTQSQPENGSKPISWSSKVVSSVKSQSVKVSKSYIKKNENTFLHALEDGDEKIILECADYEKLTVVKSDDGNPNQVECTPMEASETGESGSDNGQAQRVSTSNAPYCSSKRWSRMAQVSEFPSIKMALRRGKHIEHPLENKSPRRPKFGRGRLLTKNSLSVHANQEQLRTVESDIRSPNEYEYTVREASEECKSSSKNDQGQTLSSSVARRHSSKSRPRMAQIPEMTHAKLTFKRGKVIKPPLEEKSPRLLKFKRVRQPIKKSLGSDLGSRNESEIDARKTNTPSLENDRVRTPNSSGASHHSSKSQPRMSEIPDIAPTKLTFRRGKVVELSSENDNPSWMKFSADEEKLGAEGSDLENPNESEYTASESSETSGPISDNDLTRTHNAQHSSKSRPRIAQALDITPTKLKFRRGKVIELPSEIKSPRRLKFKQGRMLADSQDVCADARRRSFRRIVPGDGGRTGRHGSVKVVLKHRDVEGKTNAQGLLNNVIEETASKLVEVRKSKVKALVGAFETVISLQESNPSSSVVH